MRKTTRPKAKHPGQCVDHVEYTQALGSRYTEMNKKKDWGTTDEGAQALLNPAIMTSQEMDMKEKQKSCNTQPAAFVRVKFYINHWQLFCLSFLFFSILYVTNRMGTYEGNMRLQQSTAAPAKLQPSHHQTEMCVIFSPIFQQFAQNSLYILWGRVIDEAKTQVDVIFHH